MIINSKLHEIFVRFALRLTLIIAMVTAFCQPLRAADLSIVVLGDSLVAGYGLAPGKAFPEQLSNLLAATNAQGTHKVEIINAGVSGDTTTGGLARLDWSVPEGIDAVILEFGANDALRAISPNVTRKNLETIITRLQARNVRVLLAGMKAPPNLGADYVKEFDAIYPHLAHKYGLLLYPFFLEGVAAVPALNQSDAIHPTAEGIKMIAERFLPIALKLIEKLSPNAKE